MYYTPMDEPPQETREGTSFFRGLLISSALSIPLWLMIVFGIMAMRGWL